MLVVDAQQKLSEILVIVSSISKINLNLLQVSPLIRIIRSDSNNIAANRNLIFDQSKFEKVFFTDPDCLPDPLIFYHLHQHHHDTHCFALAANIENHSENKLIQAFFKTLSQSKLLSIGSKQVWHNKEIAYTRHASTSGLLFLKSKINSQKFDIFFERVGEDLEINFRLSKITGLKILAVPNAKVRHIITSYIIKFCKTIYGYGKAQGLVALRSPFLHFNPRLTSVVLTLPLLKLLPLSIIIMAAIAVSLAIVLIAMRAEVRLQQAIFLPIFFAFIFTVYSMGVLLSPISFCRRIVNQNILEKHFYNQ